MALLNTWPQDDYPAGAKFDVGSVINTFNLTLEQVRML